MFLPLQAQRRRGIQHPLQRIGIADRLSCIQSAEIFILRIAHHFIVKLVATVIIVRQQGSRNCLTRHLLPQNIRSFPVHAGRCHVKDLLQPDRQTISGRTIFLRPLQAPTEVQQSRVTVISPVFPVDAVQSGKIASGRNRTHLLPEFQSPDALFAYIHIPGMLLHRRIDRTQQRFEGREPAGRCRSKQADAPGTP